MTVAQFVLTLHVFTCERICSSFLFLCTKEGRTAILRNALNAAGFGKIAIAVGAGLALAAIDGELVLKIPKFTVGLDVIAQA